MFLFELINTFVKPCLLHKCQFLLVKTVCSKHHPFVSRIQVLFVCLFVYLFVCVYFCLFVCLFVFFCAVY